MIAISELCNPKKLLVEDTDCSQQDKLFIHTAEAITSRVSSLPLEVVFAIIEMVIKNLKYDETIAGYTSPSSLVQPNLPKYLSLASKMNVQNSCLYQSIKAKYTQFLSGKYNVILPTQEVTSRVLVPSCIQEAVNALNSTAFGKRCMEWTMWNEYFANKVCGDGLYCSIPEFLLLLNADNYFPNSTFKVLQDNTFDCVRLPIVTPDNKQIVNLWHRNHYDLLAAYCISAREYPNFVNQSEQKILSIWKGTFGMYMRSCLLELYESKGEYALQDLLLSVVHICYCIHRIENSVDVFQEFLYSLMDLAKVNASTIERCAWDACRESDVGRVYLSTLAANYSTRFSMLFTYGGEFAKNRQEVNIDLYQNVHTDNNQQSKSLSTAKEIANDLESNKICVANSNSDSLDNCEDIAESISNILTSTEGKCKQEVMELLQREFHYDQKGQRPSIETPEVRKLRNSLDLLAVSLYSSDVHFVMEVLQNADDNAYDEGIIPTLKFELFPHALVIFNNEKGFDVSNINAICNVGGSTKKGRVGYIGQKGIGFKSVFAISDRPEVHSNGKDIN